jgi:hypothetical protein
MYHCICGLAKIKVHATTCFSHKENNIKCMNFSAIAKFG